MSKVTIKNREKVFESVKVGSIPKGTFFTGNIGGNPQKLFLAVDIFRGINDTPDRCAVSIDLPGEYWVTAATVHNYQPVDLEIEVIPQ